MTESDKDVAVTESYSDAEINTFVLSLRENKKSIVENLNIIIECSPPHELIKPSSFNVYKLAKLTIDEERMFLIGLINDCFINKLKDGYFTGLTDIVKQRLMKDVFERANHSIDMVDKIKKMIDKKAI